MGKVAGYSEEKIKKGDIVKILQPDEQDKAAVTWIGTQMDNTVGLYGKVRTATGRFKLVDLQDDRVFYYTDKHLKKAKRWQVKKYERRVSKEVILLR